MKAAQVETLKYAPRHRRAAGIDKMAVVLHSTWSQLAHHLPARDLPDRFLFNRSPTMNPHLAA